MICSVFVSKKVLSNKLLTKKVLTNRLLSKKLLTKKVLTNFVWLCFGGDYKANQWSGKGCISGKLK